MESPPRHSHCVQHPAEYFELYTGMLSAFTYETTERLKYLYFERLICTQPQTPNDSLDLQLNAVYDHHKNCFWSKNQILYQKETVSEDHRRVFVMFWQWCIR